MSSDQIVHQSPDWHVYDDGTIEHPSTGYWCPADRVTQKDWNGDWYHWPCRIAAKPWANLDEGLDAWRVAVGIVHPTAPLDWVARSILQAYEVRIDQMITAQNRALYDYTRGDLSTGIPERPGSGFATIWVADLEKDERRFNHWVRTHLATPEQRRAALEVVA